MSRDKTREAVRREKHPMRARMVGADFGDNTATFEMIGDYYAAGGEYVITPAESIATLSPPAPSAEVAALVEWQPIESAPRDGTRILTWCPQSTDFTRKLNINWFKDGVWQKNANSLGHVPTHWMPLPAPPQPFTDAQEVERE
jgi:hypothetical protein